MKNRTLWHIAGWILFLAYQELESLIKEGLDWENVSIIFSLLTVRIATFYLFYIFIWHRYLQSGKFFHLLLFVPLGVLFFPGFRYLIEEIIYPAILGYGNYVNPSLSYYLKDNIIWRALPVVAASLIVYLLEQRIKAEQERRELVQQKIASELAFLRAQLNPHFLFNTLSYLHTEAFRHSPSLADTVLQLSDILRYALESAQKEKASIEEEIQLLRNYMAIFEKRFKGRFFASFTVQGQELSQQLEPLLLISFFENAFKHGITSDPECPVRFELEVEPGRLWFRSINQIRYKEKDPGTGIGLDNVRHRLALCYPGKHDLSIEENNDTFKVDLNLNL